MCHPKRLMPVLVLMMMSAWPVLPGGEKKPLDVEIAEYAIIIGGNRLARNRLARNRNDGDGLVLLRPGGAIVPMNEEFLLITAKLERDMQPAERPVKVTQEKLLAVMAKPADYLTTRGPKTEETKRLALL